MKCEKCGKELSRRNTSGYCKECYDNSNNGEETKYKIYIKEWLDSGTLKTTCSPGRRVRRYLLEQQNGKCFICGIEQKWNNKELVFVLDHEDGDSKNNKRENLRMICPNCDSQLPTYKSKNKGKGREYDKEYRLKYYYKNK